MCNCSDLGNKKYQPSSHGIAMRMSSVCNVGGLWSQSVTYIELVGK